MRWRRRSCRAGPYLGYLQAQKQRLTGERGQKRGHRPELEAMYGFDTKYAMHMLRLGFQGVELLTTGHLSLPMQKPERSFLLDLRRGKVSEEECLVRAGELEQQLPDRFMLSPYYAPGVFCRPPLVLAVLRQAQR